MKRYEVSCTFYNGDTWERRSGKEAVEASDEVEAREEISSRSCPWEDYVVSKVAEVKGNE